jgi:hypothetical protein
MAGDTEIANVALRAIGASRITSLTQGTKNANYLNDIYAELRDKLLEMHHWNFATKSVKLAQTATTPAVEFDNQYTLPADFIRLVRAHSDDQAMVIVDHRLRDGKLESSASEVWIVYISRVTDPNQMTPLFRDALSMALAVEAATGIAESNTMAERMQKKFEKAMRRARSADAQSDLPDRMPPGSWLTSRTGRNAERRWSW